MTRLSGDAHRPLPTSAEGAGELLPRVDPVASLPVVTLFPFSRCNCRCAMCDIWKEKGSASLTRLDVEALLPDLRALGTRRAILSGGEPLMHPRLFDVVEPLREAGIGLTLLSSGLLLERHAAEIARSFDDVVASLDGPREVHDAIRGVPGAYERLGRGTAALRRERPGLPVSGRCTVQGANLGRLRETVRAAREIGLTRISFLAADVTSEAFNRPGGWEAADAARVAPAPDGLSRLAEELDALEREEAPAFASGFLAESPAKLRERLLGHFRALSGEGPFPPSRCNAPWVSAVVEADGTVRPCFFHAPYGRLGSGPGEGLAALLNGERALAFRRALDVATDPTCVKCTCRLNLRGARP